MWGGGVMPRVAGLNAQENSACRSTLGSGAPGSFSLSAIVTVTRASATERRETGAKRTPSYPAVSCPSAASWLSACCQNLALATGRLNGIGSGADGRPGGSSTTRLRVPP